MIFFSTEKVLNTHKIKKNDEKQNDIKENKSFKDKYFNKEFLKKHKTLFIVLLVIFVFLFLIFVIVSTNSKEEKVPKKKVSSYEEELKQESIKTEQKSQSEIKEDSKPKELLERIKQLSNMEIKTKQDLTEMNQKIQDYQQELKNLGQVDYYIKSDIQREISNLESKSNKWIPEQKRKILDSLRTLENGLYGNIDTSKVLAELTEYQSQLDMLDLENKDKKLINDKINYIKDKIDKYQKDQKEKDIKSQIEQYISDVERDMGKFQIIKNINEIILKIQEYEQEINGFHQYYIESRIEKLKKLIDEWNKKLEKKKEEDKIDENKKKFEEIKKSMKEYKFAEPKEINYTVDELKENIKNMNTAFEQYKKQILEINPSYDCSNTYDMYDYSDHENVIKKFKPRLICKELHRIYEQALVITFNLNKDNFLKNRNDLLEPIYRDLSAQYQEIRKSMETLNSQFITKIDPLYETQMIYIKVTINNLSTRISLQYQFNTKK